MAGYCRKAANDLGFPVLCPGKLPRLVEIIPCRGPAPEEKLWGKHCFDYVLDVLFAGPPGYPGLFQGPGRRTGHLAIWTIGPESDLYPDGLFACPSGSQMGRPDQLGAHEGSWWTCPPGEAANLNTGHVAFQWVENGVVYGLSVHGDASVNEPIVRGVFEQLSLVGPHDAGGSPSAGSANLLSC
jgi:hypothetical protein